MNILTENSKLYNGDCLEVMDKLIEIVKKEQEMLNKRGIQSVTKATEEDFDRL